MSDDDWKPYFGGRKKLDHPSGFTLIVPESYKPPPPVFCPLCTFAFRTSEDLIYWEKHGCCSKCGMKWVDPDRARWLGGWRPSADEVADEIRARKLIPLSLDLSAFCAEDA